MLLLNEVKAKPVQEAPAGPWCSLESRFAICRALRSGVHPDRKARTYRSGTRWTNEPNDPAADIPWLTSTKKKNQQWWSGC